MKTSLRLLPCLVIAMLIAAPVHAMNNSRKLPLSAALYRIPTDRTQEHRDLLDGGRVKACQDEGLTSYYRGQYQEAVGQFTSCIDRGLTSDRVYYFRGRTYAELNEYGKAITDFSRAIAMNPDSSEAVSQRADMYYQRGEMQLAKEDVARVLSLGNNAKSLARALRVQAHIFQAEGKPELARVSFDRALKIDPALGWFRMWNEFLSPKQMSRFGMFALILVPFLLIFKLSIPAPKKRR